MLILDNEHQVRLVDDEGVPDEEIEDSNILEIRGPTHRAVGPDNESHCCAFSPDEEIFAWSYGNGFVKVIYLSHVGAAGNAAQDGHIQGDSMQTDYNWSQKIDCAKTVQVMKFATGPYSYDENGNLRYILATGLENGRIKIWNPLTADMIYNLSDHYSCIEGLSFAPCGEPLLISCSIDKTLKVWDLSDDGNMTLTITGHHLAVLDCAYSPTDPGLICSVGKGKTVIIWKLVHKRSFKLLRQLRGHLNDVVSCSWSPDGALVATASHDTTAIIWDPHIGHRLLLLGHLNPQPEPIFAGGANEAWVRSVCFSPDGSRVVTLCEDDKVRVWPLCSSRDIVTKTLVNPGSACQFSPSGSHVAVGKSDGSVTILCVGAEIMPLCHLSRMALRRVLPSPMLDTLEIPPAIRKYLQYRSNYFTMNNM